MFMDHEQVEEIKRRYPPGTRIRLGSMNDPFAPVPPGTEGEVTLVDGIGQLHMRWDNGRSLALIPGEDSFTVIARPEQAPQEEPAEAPRMGGMTFE